MVLIFGWGQGSVDDRGVGLLVACSYCYVLRLNLLDVVGCVVGGEF